MSLRTVARSRPAAAAGMSEYTPNSASIAPAVSRFWKRATARPSSLSVLDLETGIDL
jgi:hypothetical protein